jgi:hypothetical protein
MLVDYADCYSKILAGDEGMLADTGLKPQTSADNEEGELERLNRDYRMLLATTGVFIQPGSDLHAQFSEKMSQFELEFATMKSHLQNNRAAIHQMRDDIDFKKKMLEVGRSDQEINSGISNKKSLCRLLEDRILELKPKP